MVCVCVCFHTISGKSRSRKEKTTPTVLTAWTALLTFWIWIFALLVRTFIRTHASPGSVISDSLGKAVAAAGFAPLCER